MWIRVIACTLVVGVAGLLACGSEPEGGPSTSPPPAVAALPVPEPPALDRVTLPENFPSDVPGYPGASLESVRVDPGSSMLVTYRTDDGADDVTAFFVENLKSNGWWIENDQGGAVFASKETRTASVMIMESANGTQIDVIVAGVQ